MTHTNDGGPAFPREDYQTSDAPGQRGMSLRDYFAAKALAAILPIYIDQNGCGCAADHALPNCSALAYKYADAMIAERTK